MDQKELVLANLPTMWVTCAKTIDKRQDGLLGALQTLKISHPTAIMCELTRPYYLGLAKGHLEALKCGKPPFLIVEDDARIIPGNERATIVVPNNADALYLGTTLFGRINGNTQYNSVISSIHNDNLFRVYNMLAMHGVIYLTERYVEHSIKCFQDYVDNPHLLQDGPQWASDNIIADTMWRYNVLCLRKPILYQDDGKANTCTQEPLIPTFIR